MVDSSRESFSVTRPTTFKPGCPAIETIRAVADQQNRSVIQLEEAIETLRNQADVLRGEVRRFRV